MISTVAVLVGIVRLFFVDIMLLGLGIRGLFLRIDRPLLIRPISSRIIGVGRSACRTDVGVGHLAKRRLTAQRVSIYSQSFRLNNVFVTNKFFFVVAFDVLEKQRERETNASF